MVSLPPACSLGNLVEVVRGACRYPAGTLTGIRGMQVLCRYPDRCQGFANIVRRLSACIRVPHREGNSMGGPPLFNVRIRNQRTHGSVFISFTATCAISQVAIAPLLYRSCKHFIEPQRSAFRYRNFLLKFLGSLH